MIIGDGMKILIRAALLGVVIPQICLMLFGGCAENFKWGGGGERQYFHEPTKQTETFPWGDYVCVRDGKDVNCTKP